MKIGFLHTGIVQEWPSGVTRYGQIIAEGVKKLASVEVREASVTFSWDQANNEKELRSALDALADVDVISIQFTPQIWGRVQIKKLIPVLFFRMQAPVAMTVHDTIGLNYFYQLTVALRGGGDVSVLTIICRWLLFCSMAWRARLLIVHSLQEAKNLPLAFFWRRKICMIRHFVERRKAVVDPLEAKKVLGLEGGLVVTVLGFMFGRKRHDLLIKAASKFPPGTKIVFAGGAAPGSEGYVTGLWSLARKLGVEHQLRITGFLSDEQQDLYMAATDIAVLPFQYIAASGSLSTWIASGQPVILTSKLPQFEEYNDIVPGVIKTFSPYTPEALASRITEIAADLSCCRGSGRTTELANKLSVDGIAGDYADIFTRLAGKPSPVFHVVHFPLIDPYNPYLRCFYDALNGFSINSSFGGSFSPSMIRYAGKFADAVHLHWLEYVIRKDSMFSGLSRFLCFMATLSVIKHSGLPLIWTCHNLLPHQGADRWDRFLTRHVARQADMIICHSSGIEEALLEMGIAKEKICHVRHPSYTGYYPNTVGRDKARDQIGVALDAHVYLFCGLIKPYKGLEDLIEAFSVLKDPEAVLLIVGRDFTNVYARDVIAPLVAKDPRIKLRHQFVSLDDFEAYHSAADVLVYPFKRVDTSGSMMLPFTFPRPVIVRDLRLSRSLFTEKEVVFFKDIPGLTHALHEACQRDRQEVVKALEQRDEELRWEKLIVPIAQRIWSLKKSARA